MWEVLVGDIPDGYDVHHKDDDKENNDLSNFELLPSKEHVSGHSKVRANTEEWRDKWKEIRQKGSDSHKRPEERKKQSERSKQQWANRKANEKPSIIICSVCGSQKETYYPAKTTFCSRKCKAKAQRKRFREEHGYGYDKHIRSNRVKPRPEPKQKSTIICSICRKEKETHLPEQTKFCSRACQAKDYRRRKNENAKGKVD